MGLKQIFQNFSLDTLLSLPPSELLALVVMALLVAIPSILLLLWAVDLWDARPR